MVQGDRSVCFFHLFNTLLKVCWFLGPVTALCDSTVSKIPPTLRPYLQTTRLCVGSKEHRKISWDPLDSYEVKKMFNPVSSTIQK